MGKAVTGNAKGAIYGALAAASITGIFFLHGAINVNKGFENSLKALLLGVFAGFIAAIDAEVKGSDVREAFFRGIAHAALLTFIGGLVQGYAENRISQLFGDPELVISLIKSCLLELGVSLVKGEFLKHPMRAIGNILINAGVTYIQYKYVPGLMAIDNASDTSKEIYDRTLGFIAARINDMIWVWRDQG